MKRLLLSAFLALGACGLGATPSHAWLTFGLIPHHGCCGHCGRCCSAKFCVRQYNAFTPVACGSLCLDGCFPFGPNAGCGMGGCGMGGFCGGLNWGGIPCGGGACGGGLCCDGSLGQLPDAGCLPGAPAGPAKPGPVAGPNPLPNPLPPAGPSSQLSTPESQAGVLQSASYYPGYNYHYMNSGYNYLPGYNYGYQPGAMPSWSYSQYGR